MSRFLITQIVITLQSNLSRTNNTDSRLIWAILIIYSLWIYCGFLFKGNINSVTFLLLFATLELYFCLTFTRVVLKSISRFEISLISNVLKKLHTSIIFKDGIWKSFLSVSFNPVCFNNHWFRSVRHSSLVATLNLALYAWDP